MQQTRLYIPFYHLQQQTMKSLVILEILLIFMQYENIHLMTIFRRVLPILLY
uniref:Uncharacterized protein n=1 Tax=Rhizophora mucronata TaxID=61149 RepID=A0A2P2J0Y0_RHIMU